MPRYTYECSECEEQFQVVHGMNEEQQRCEICFSQAPELKRIPQLTYIASKENQSAKRVKDAIEENRKILKQASKEARNTKYDG